MEKNHRKLGSAMDGFVPRSRRMPQRRASLDQGKARHRPARVTDGFIPRAQPANQPSVRSRKDQWVDDSTLAIGDIESVRKPQKRRRIITGGEGVPKWWQFGKKRRFKKGKPEPSRRKKIIKRIIILAGLLMVLIAGYLGWKFLQATGRVFDGNVLGFFDSTKLRGEEEGRVNILLAGTSEDDGPEHGGADLTDSIMLVSIDTKNNTGFTVSIPRDLWVRYGERCSAGYEGKINVAYQCGNDVDFKEPGYAAGGMGLLQKIVSTHFGLPIHYYGKINYTAFKDAVDAVGGITITVNSDDPRGIYDPNIQRKDGGPLRLKNGPQKLDGKTALALARSRNSAGGYGMSRGDFDRTTYQRAMLLALKDKALSSGVVANPAKIGGLLDAAGNNVSTDFKSSEVRRLYELSKLIQNNKVQSIDLADEEVSLVTTGMYNGQSIVRPTAGITNFNQIKSYFKKLTSTDPVVREAANVVVLNGSGVPGLAQKRADELAVKGLTIGAVGNGTARARTVVVDMTNNQKPTSRTLLQKQFGVTAVSAASVPEAKNYQADFVVVLGKNATGNGTN